MSAARQSATTPAAQLAARIRKDGPITVAAYMEACLFDPDWGYYAGAARRNRESSIGRGGDFITAPEISQMFGELIGLWAVDCWRAMGLADPLRLVELGPGRGTLLADAVRAIGQVAAAASAPRLHLVEISPVLRRAQAAALAAHHPTWHRCLDEVPSGPAVYVANELFDALPGRQLVRCVGAAGNGWRERLVDVDESTGDLCFRLGPVLDGTAVPAELHRAAAAYRHGELATVSEPAHRLCADIARRLATDGGAALVIDYGYAAGHGQRAVGDTLQAVAGHTAVDPLQRPGDSDLTLHVDFGALAAAARGGGATVWGPLTQGIFLQRLGIETRAARLAAGQPAARQVEIAAAHARLTADDQMGKLFEVMALIDTADWCPAGFVPADRGGEMEPA